MGAHVDHDRSEATGIGLSVIEPGLATNCNCWSYSDVCGTCFSVAVCQLVPFIITWLQVRHLYFSLLSRICYLSCWELLTV